MLIGYLGPEGTFTEEAALQMVADLNLENPKLIPLSPIAELFWALSNNAIDSAVVPRANSLAGDYRETIAGLQNYGFRTLHEMELLIRLAIGIHPEASEHELSEVWSKDTALKECSFYLDANFPGLRRVEVESTAYGMKETADKGLTHIASVGSILGCNKYGLKMLYDDIGNHIHNYTTFFMVGE